MTLTPYYKNAFFIPAVPVITGYFLYSVYDSFLGEEYSSEWLTKESANIIAVGMVTLNAIFIGLLSLPIFLNQRALISQNLILSALAWLAFPMVWIFYLLGKHVGYLIHYANGLDTESFFVLTNTLPYLIALCWTFIRFRQKLNREGK